MSVRKKPADKKEKIFVVQKHWATNLHYDFRIEINRTLWSWAVPKGPPLKKGEKRLAMRTANHAMAYAKFEGEITEGYGAGKVKIWDKGTIELIEKTKDKIHFKIYGKQLKGEYALIRFESAKPKGEAWLLIKI